MLKNLRRGSLALVLTLVLSCFIPIHATHAAATWTATSKRDSYDRPDVDSRYNIEYVSTSIFDNSVDELYFYLHFTNMPKTDLFNDGKGSWAFIGLDYDGDDKSDIRLELSDVTLKTDRTAVSGEIYDTRSQSFPNCSVDIFTNIDEGRWWIGFEVSRLCIKLPQTFGIQGYSDYLESDDKSFDYAPDSHFVVTLPGGKSGSSSGPSSTGQIPRNIANESTSLQNFSAPPTNLTTLSEKLSPSVVTVFCSNGKGSGWAIKSELDNSLTNSGYRSYVISNHHVVEDCLVSKRVQLQLSDGKLVNGTVISWDENSDVAGIATAQTIPGLEWIGTTPKQGWWVGVIGSPGSLVGILTTGIISSINSEASTFTFTAAINPGNSGGPIFDSTGRVLGLATSKNLLSNGSLAEGSGNGHGVPLLCGVVILCVIEKNPWGATSKFVGGPSAAELEALAKAEADARAKAEAEAKAKAEADARAALELRLREDKVKQCIDFNGDLNVALFTLNSSKAIYPKSLSAFQGLINAAPMEMNCNDINLQSFDSQLLNQRKLLSAFQISTGDVVANAKILATKRTTITCVKGKLTKKVTAVKPKCPAGYKKK